MEINIDDIVRDDLSSINNDSLYAETTYAFDEFDRGDPVPYPRPMSPFRGWLGHILYVVGIKIMDWSQIVCWGSKNWCHGRRSSE